MISINNSDHSLTCAQCMHDISKLESPLTNILNEEIHQNYCNKKYSCHSELGLVELAVE